jgi:hypothetical protein
MFSPTDSDSASVGWSRADSPESNSSHESELLIQIDYGSSPEVDRWEALKLLRPSVRPLRTDGIHGREKFHSNIDHIEFSGSSSSDFDLNQPDLNEEDFDSDGRLSPEDRHNGPAAEVLHISAIAQSSSILPLRGEERGISGPTGLASMLVSDAIEEERFRHTGTEAARAAEDQRLRHEEQARREEQARLRREAEERALQDERAPLQHEKAQRASHEEQASLQREAEQAEARVQEEEHCTDEVKAELLRQAFAQPQNEVPQPASRVPVDAEVSRTGPAMRLLMRDSTDNKGRGSISLAAPMNGLAALIVSTVSPQVSESGSCGEHHACNEVEVAARSAVSGSLWFEDEDVLDADDSAEVEAAGTIVQRQDEELWPTAIGWNRTKVAGNVTLRVESPVSSVAITTLSDTAIPIASQIADDEAARMTSTFGAAQPSAPPSATSTASSWMDVEQDATLPACRLDDDRSASACSLAGQRGFEAYASMSDQELWSEGSDLSSSPPTLSPTTRMPRIAYAVRHSEDHITSAPACEVDAHVQDACRVSGLPGEVEQLSRAYKELASCWHISGCLSRNAILEAVRCAPPELQDLIGWRRPEIDEDEFQRLFALLRAKSRLAWDSPKKVEEEQFISLFSQFAKEYLGGGSRRP